MSRNSEHAKVLAAIAAQVVETYRAEAKAQDQGTPTFPTASTVSHDPSWDFRIPERYQG